MRRVGFVALISALVLAAPAHAAFPGKNGKIAFVRLKNYTPATGWQEADIYTINPDGTGESRLTQGVGMNGPPSWSPDGSKIAFSSNRDGNSEIYVMSSEGSAQTRLTNDPVYDSSPAWSPDGGKLAFVSNRDGPAELYSMSADGTGVTRLTNSTGSWSPAWSSDGTKIAFTREPPRFYPFEEVYSINPDGSGLTRLTSGGLAVANYSPNWSPDGRAIAWAQEYNGTSDCVFQYECIRIMKMNADGSGQTPLTPDVIDFNREPAWSPDGSKIAFENNARIVQINPDGSGLTTSVPRVSGEFAGGPDWQPIPGPNRGDYKNAAEFCKADRDFLGDEAFSNKYGTNGNGANAFGKCVSQNA